MKGGCFQQALRSFRAEARKSLCVEKVVAASPKNIDEKEATIRQVIAAIPQSTLQRVVLSFKSRLDLCEKALGGHFEVQK